MNLREQCFLSSDLETVEKSLKVAGFVPNQNLKKESISYITALLYFYDKPEQFNSDQCTRMIALVEKRFCGVVGYFFWE
jgi:hypothetical protein